jgi:hypothetical protein
LPQKQAPVCFRLTRRVSWRRRWSKEAALARGEQHFGSEIALTFNIGGKSVGVRADVLTCLPDGRYVYIESKCSPAASYTKNQNQVIPQLVAAGDRGMTATIDVFLTLR